MLDALKNLFGGGSPTPQQDADRLHVVAATLLLEVSKADYRSAPAELAAIEGLLLKHFELAPEAIESLLTTARAEFDAANSLYPFTRFINDHCSDDEKYQLIAHAWHVAHVDGVVSKYEEHLIRHLAELIYLPHSAFIRAKLEAEAAATNGG